MGLSTITDLINDQLIATEKEMHNSMHSDVPLVNEVSQHIAEGGKRIRPTVVLLCTSCFGFHEKEAIYLAAIIEFMHTATLLHDDVVDGSNLRRGKDTANNLWGNEASVLVGDFLYSRAFQLLIKTKQLDLMQLLADASNVMAEGEMLQLTNRHNPGITEEIYYQIIHAKTATLFQAATEMAAALCNATEEQKIAMRDYGKHLGLAFQLVDDALDYNSDSETLGKNIGDDLAEGKVTLPLLYLLHQGSDEHKSLIQEAIATGGLEQLEAIKQAVLESSAIIYTLDRAKSHIEKAQSSLAVMPANKYQNGLTQLAKFVIDRSY